MTREQIARIIAPEPAGDGEAKTALDKADRILALDDRDRIRQALEFAGDRMDGK